MKLIELFNEQINRTNSDKFSFWSDYRTQIEKQVLSFLNGTQKSALVVGTGNSDDVPLKLLTDYFKQVILTDIDLNSVKIGIQKHGINKEDEEKIEMYKLEYTGLGKVSFFNDFIKLIKEHCEIDVIKQYIDIKINEMKSYFWIDKLSSKYDFIFVSPLYTQLVYQQAVAILKEFPHYEDLNSYFLDKMTEIIDHFNDNLLIASERNAVIFVLSDIFEAMKNTPFFNQILTSILDYQQMEQLYQDYVRTYGYGLGDYGLVSLSNKAEKLYDRWFIWPFNEEKIMVVKMNVFKVIK